ncbi:MAG: tRNA 2-thiouridine(34) synthase MnmA [Myxococcota bacterium]|nr:tRNA 2-thiouridine(34) synthase MnmA [Myxococcota bacterium]
MRVVVAMSGGVDSSVAAGLMKEAGHDVIGLAMKTHGMEPKANRACCTPDDMRDARTVADILDVPFYLLPYENVFAEAVIRPFAEAYLMGRTPNPCIECNDKVKFKPLLERAKMLGADVLVTGHYAQISTDQGRRYLRRGSDQNKDQSYFLYRLSQDQLARLEFPVGAMCKDEVREHASRLGLPVVANKHESQEICFVGSRGYAATVEEILGHGGLSGNFVNAAGEVLGKHSGIHHYTLGQRRGLGLSASEPLYVLSIDAQTGDVLVGPASQLSVRFVDVDGLTWAGDIPESGCVFLLQQRYRSKPFEVRLEWRTHERLRLHFLEERAPGAPGQAAVLYCEERVVGGGVICGDERSVVSEVASNRLPIVNQQV